MSKFNHSLTILEHLYQNHVYFNSILYYLVQAFQTYDVEQNLSVTKGEFRRILETFCFPMSSEQFQSLVAKVSWKTQYIASCRSLLRGVGWSSEVERSLMVRWVVGSILHGVDPLSYFSFQPVLHKGRGMCYPVWDGAYKRMLAVNRKE